MRTKDKIRKNFSLLRKKKYFEVTEKFFFPLIPLIKKIRLKKIKIASYYPSNYEVNTLSLFQIMKKKNISISLPTIFHVNKMKFLEWTYLDPLKVNKYGMLEPTSLSKTTRPNIFLVPLLAYDNQKNRLGYGKGFYDTFLNSYFRQNKKIVTIGVAFSFQKYNKLPVSQFDFKLDYVLTEKGIY